MSISTLTGPQFANTFGVRPSQFAWFLGAGASAAAGIPTGYSMIRDFKKRLFCQMAGLKLREVDAADPLWTERMDEFFRIRAVLPPADDPSEYSAAFEAVFQTPEDRRRYIDDAIKKGTPSFAHKVLAALISSNLSPCIFTTNFDQLVETAATLTGQLLPPEGRAHLAVAALDSVDRAQRCLRESDWPLLAKLHGDFQSVALKNTEAELKAQDEKMRMVLTGACGRFGLVVVGYSGRDASVMKALTATLSQPDAFPGGIYWVARSSTSVLPAVTDFLQAAVDAGVTAAIVESQNFDELAGDIADRISLPQVLLNHLYDGRPAPVLSSVPLPTREIRKFPLLRCSAIPVLEMPKVARFIAVDGAVTSVRARELLRDSDVWAIAASNGQGIAAFGPDEGLLRAFAPIGGRIAGTIELDPAKDSWALGLVYDALTRAICRRQPLRARLRRSGHFVLVGKAPEHESDDRARDRRARLAKLQEAYSAALVGVIPNLGFDFNEGVQLRLEQTAGRWWCVFDPTTYVDVPRTESPALSDDGDVPEMLPTALRKGDPAGDWRRERWARRYNGTWSKLLDAWSALLTGENGGTLQAVGLPEAEGIDAVFRLSPVTAWSRPSHEHSYFSRYAR